MVEKYAAYVLLACFLNYIFFCEFDAMNAPALTDDLRDLFRNLSF